MNFGLCVDSVINRKKRLNFGLKTKEKQFDNNKNTKLMRKAFARTVC